VARKLEVEIVGDASSLNRAVGQADSSFNKLAKRGAFVGAAGLAAVAVGAKKVVDAASNLNESINAVNVVFGKSAGRIHAFAKVADKEAGLSMRQLNELVTPLGASFTNLGDSQDVAAKKSIALAKRAADMASVFNVDVSEALEAIQAGLRGEADPLERFGVGLSDAAVKAKAMKMGLAETEKGLTAQDKAQARYALILSQTNKLQGDFKNTSGEAANAARINAASQENLNAKIGKGLLPIMKLYEGLLKSVTAFMSKHTTAVKVAAGIVAGFGTVLVAVYAATLAWSGAQKVAGAATKAWAAAQWLLNAAMAANPIVLVAIAIAALVAGLILAWKTSETFRDVVKGALDAVSDAAQAVLDFFKDNWPEIATLISGPFAPLVLLATDAFGIRSALKKAINGIITWIKGKFTEILNTGKAFGDKLKSGVVSGVTGIANAAWDLLKGIGSRIAEKLGDVKKWGTNIGSGIKSSIISGITGVAGEVWEVLKNIGAKIVEKASAIAGWGGDLGKKLKSGAIEALKGIADAIVTAVRSAINALIDRVNSALEFKINIRGAPDIHVNPPDIPHIGKGGIVSRPTVALIGERGPEAIVPLNRANGFGGGMQTINLVLDGKVLASVLLDPLRNQAKIVQARTGAAVFG
jgi:phage-related protein